MHPQIISNIYHRKIKNAALPIFEGQEMGSARLQLAYKLRQSPPVRPHDFPLGNGMQDYKG
jgi:hypothetical protein